MDGDRHGNYESLSVGFLCILCRCIRRVLRRYHPRMRPDAVRGHLDLLLLSLIADRTFHGYALIEELRARSAGEFDLAEGTVYPALHRLERASQLSSEWRTVAGRRRRYYRLTDVGRTALAEERIQWRRLSTAITTTISAGPVAHDS